MNDELEPEIMTYRAFCERQTRLAWEARRRAYVEALDRGEPPEKQTDQTVRIVVNSASGSPSLTT